ncbi:MAG: hypothetical protein J5662_08380 [Clostridia bacterium]|nr:hypothetical protein [Clostridia bacterium]
MKINSIVERAALLCGISDGYLKENDQSELNARALTAANTVLFDLCGEAEHRSILDEVSVSRDIENAAVYGVAMFLCLAFGDTDKASLFSHIYSDKRALVKSAGGKISDVLPKTEASV